MPRVPLNMPKMSMTMEFGTVVEWLVAPGDPIRNGDAVVVVTTDKVDMEVEATFDGVLTEILAGEGDQLPVGQPMAWVETEADDLLGDLFDAPAAPAQDEAAQDETAESKAAQADEAPTTEPAAEPSAAAPGAAQPAAAGSGGDVRAVPLARRLAAEAGVDLTTVAATGPARTIRARDVRDAIGRRGGQAAEAAPVRPEPATSAPPAAVAALAPAATPEQELLGDPGVRRLRVATARVMEASAAIPQFTVFRALDLARLARAREVSLKGVSWTSILVRAYALVLREFPQLNGSWAGGGVRANPGVGIALAIDTPRGLLAPTIADPDRLTLRELDRRVRELAEAIKRGEVDPNLLAGATGTVSNLGGMGVDRFTALLTPPQATALSLGRVGHRPVVDADGELGVGIGCDAGLTVDHRVADGADAARALEAMQAFLSDPVLLLA